MAHKPRRERRRNTKIAGSEGALAVNSEPSGSDLPLAMDTAAIGEVTSAMMDEGRPLKPSSPLWRRPIRPQVKPRTETQRTGTSLSRLRPRRRESSIRSIGRRMPPPWNPSHRLPRTSGPRRSASHPLRRRPRDNASEIAPRRALPSSRGDRTPGCCRGKNSFDNRGKRARRRGSWSASRRHDAALWSAHGLLPRWSGPAKRRCEVSHRPATPSTY